MQGFALFKTAIGTAAVAWGPRGIIGAQLPEREAAGVRAGMHRRFPEAQESEPPAAVQRVIDDIVALMEGERRDLRDAQLDFERIPEFHRRVYDVARAIAPGEVLTYGQLAEKLGEPGAARAVGQAMGANPFAPIVPCHRVLGANGKTGGFSARGGTETKMRLLTIERAQPGGAPSLFADLPLAAKPPRRR